VGDFSMTGEGELYQKILNIPSFTGKKMIVVIRVLDEAKAEFPDFDKIGNFALYRSEVDAFKRKWFGGSE
jgi:hypothetical protein